MLRLNFIFTLFLSLSLCGPSVAPATPAMRFSDGVVTTKLNVDNIQLDGNTISTTNSNGDLTLDMNGTGKIILTDLSATTVPYLDASKKIQSSAVTPTELGYLSGVSSAIQTQLGLKAPIASPTFTGTVTVPVTASRALQTDGSSGISASAVTSTELGYLSGVTSAIQTQLGLKAPLASPTFTGTITTPLTANRAVVTGSSGVLAAATTTDTEIGYVNGVTSAIQTQLNAKAPLASPTFTGAVGIPDGLVGTPGLAFSGDLDNGLYRITANDWALSAGGDLGLELNNIGSHLVNAGIGGAASASSVVPFVVSRTLNSAISAQFNNPSSGTASSMTLAVTVGPSSNVLSLENFAENTSAYFGGGSIIRSNGNQTQLIISSEYASAFTAFTIGGTSAATEKARFNSTSLALKHGTNLTFDGSSSGTVTLAPAAAAGTYSMTLPNALGSTGDVLTLGTSGTTSWVTPSTFVASVPTGTLIQFAAATCPTGYLAADGSAASRTTYATLWGVIGNTWGVGDGSTTFTLPNMSGKFARGGDFAAGNDPDSTTRTQQTSGTFTVGGGSTSNGSPNIVVTSTGELAPGMTVSGTNIPANSVVMSITDSTHFVLGNLANTASVNATGTTGSLTFTFSKSATADYVGSVQTDGFKSHTHVMSVTWGSLTSNSGPVFAGSGDNRNATSHPPTGASNDSTGGNETRPINAYVKYCIKY